LIVEGADKAPEEYRASEKSITGMQATRGPTFAQLQYANTSGHTVVARVKSTSGFSTAIALPPTSGSETGTIGLILPHGTADVSFEDKLAEIRKMDVYSW
jgi:hypothetical protein